MKIEEFTEVIKHAENFYGKEMPEEQKKFMFHELKNMEIARFKYIIAQHYRESPYLPKVPDILAINKKLGYSQIKKESESNKCKECNGTGYVTYKKQINNGTAGTLINEYGAVCKCRKKQKYKGWEIADQEHRTNFYTPYIEEVVGG